MIKTATPFLAIICIILLVSSLSAITGSIGNARMILKAEVGDDIQRSVLVKNPNDVSVDIKLFPGGDLASEIDIVNPEFTLSPGEEKKAFFKLTVKETGTTENKINIQFIPTDGKEGVGLSSTVIIIASEKGTLTEKDKERLTESETNGFSKISGNFIGGEDGISGQMLLGIITTIILIIFLIVLMIYSKKIKRRRNKSNDNVNINNDEDNDDKKEKEGGEDNKKSKKSVTKKHV